MASITVQKEDRTMKHIIFFILGALILIGLYWLLVSSDPKAGCYGFGGCPDHATGRSVSTTGQPFAPPNRKSIGNGAKWQPQGPVKEGGM